MKLCLGAAAFVALVQLPSLAQEVAATKEYVLASEDPPMPVGITHQVADNSNMLDGKVKMKFGERDFAGNMSKMTKEVQVIDYLADDKIKVIYAKSRGFGKTVMMGKAGGEEEVDPIEGRVVLLSKAEGKWSGRLQGDPVEPVDHEKVDDKIKKLAKSLNNRTEESVGIYGINPRKVGDTWKVDPKNVPGMDEFKIEDGTMTVTFLEVKQLNGENCAVLKGEFSMNGLMTEEKMQGMKGRMSGEMRIVRSLKYFMDYKLEGEIKIAVDGVMEPQPGIMVDFVMNAGMKIKKSLIILPAEKGGE